MTDNTWTWLVAYGAYRASICTETATKAAIRKFHRAFEQYAIIQRPAGYHWDGGKL